jgi:hypothetical protein
VHDSEGAIDENQYVAFREVKIVKMPTDLPGTRTMPANVKLARTIRAISINLDEAIASYETFVPTGQNASLIDRMNTTDFYPAFNVISDALHRSVIATLCRIWDTRQDTADLNGVAADFRDAQVIADLAAVWSCHRFGPVEQMAF